MRVINSYEKYTKIVTSRAEEQVKANNQQKLMNINNRIKQEKSSFTITSINLTIRINALITIISINK